MKKFGSWNDWITNIFQEIIIFKHYKWMGHILKVYSYQKTDCVSKCNKKFHFEHSHLGYEGKLVFIRLSKNLAKMIEFTVSNIVDQFSISNGSIWCEKHAYTMYNHITIS